LGIVGFAQGFEFKEQPDGVMLYEDGEPRFFYQSKTKTLDGKYPRANYIHPLYGLDGGILTEDFPADHPHQRGIYWAWHQLYKGDRRLGNGWICENFVWDVRQVFTSVEDDKAYLKTVVFWLDSAGEEYVVETLEMNYERVSNKEYKMNFEIRLQALQEDIYLGGSEDSKGYGGFSARLKLPEPVSFLSQKGSIQPTENPVRVGDRVSLYGKFNPEEDPFYITIHGDTTHLNSFQGWILREKESMQNFAFPGKDPILIPMDEPLQLVNTIVVHRNRKSRTLNRQSSLNSPL
jgi:hypothetical protein